MNKEHIENFTQSLNIYETNYTHDNLIEFLHNGTVAQKQAAALKLDSINSQYDAQILIDNLTGCDGKIREAVSFKLKEFVNLQPEYFTKYSDIFLSAVIDINGNICRNTICALRALKKYKDFTNEFTKKLTCKTSELSKRAKTFDIQDGKYKINKELFKLYWYLETIYEFAEFIKSDILYEILNDTKNVQDYTIREKTAKILSAITDKRFDDIKKEIADDNNYYVKNFNNHYTKS